jgi:hypothetical protein
MVVSEEEIEAAAKILYECAPQYLVDEVEGIITGPKPWEWMGDEYQEMIRSQVRVVLSAFSGNRVD